ncbi:ABC-2 type transport system ATP-binding protein [Actinopolyspora xinjiangensis]|uniref:ABC-2 type transport system ATP-binding protein n=1 Tax=Actinopolyspora xinjiangensis TaxID=405564 RepID=A0A1H0V9N5_9ACTN|nr:ATP-binding cassette domain-containing protein [Actinopolyspora xinjiangensis]SDP74796.1 ABC-2 type transport system ATP-binding protein [Actinopolyspora xinjiangensis]
MLALEHLRKSYGTRPVLHDVSLPVERGEILGFVGGNGAGKTTSMRIVLGVTEADSGRVLLDGEPVDDGIRSRMGYMPEERGLYDTMRVEHQLRFFAELRGLTRGDARRAAAYWLEVLGLSQRRQSRLQELSLGNQQRVQLAAALVHAPDTLVLDEPFSGLDPLAVDVMSRVLREEADRGVPVIFSSHQLDLVERVCDRVAVLRQGSLLAHGTVAELTDEAQPRYLVRSDADSRLWSAELDSAARDTLEPAPDGGVIVSLAGTPEGPDHLADAVRRHGSLLELRPWRPSLFEIYRSVVDPHPADQEESTA